MHLANKLSSWTNWKYIYRLMLRLIGNKIKYLLNVDCKLLKVISRNWKSTFFTGLGFKDENKKKSGRVLQLGHIALIRFVHVQASTSILFLSNSRRFFFNSERKKWHDRTMIKLNFCNWKHHDWHEVCSTNSNDSICIFAFCYKHVVVFLSFSHSWSSPKRKKI